MVLYWRILEAMVADEFIVFASPMAESASSSDSTSAQCPADRRPVSASGGEAASSVVSMSDEAESLGGLAACRSCCWAPPLSAGVAIGALGLSVVAARRPVVDLVTSTLRRSLVATRQT